MATRPLSKIIHISDDELPEGSILRQTGKPAKIAEAIEDIPEGEEMVIDIGLGLAARPFEADRDGD